MRQYMNYIYKSHFLLLTIVLIIISSTLIPKQYSFAQNGTQEPIITYSVHAQSYGWMTPVEENKIAGTTGESKRLEALSISLNTYGLTATDGSPLTGAIKCKTHVQSYGWMDEVTFDASDKNDSRLIPNANYAGTLGKAKRMEALTLSLTGKLAEEYDILYRVHVQSYGWMNWEKNGGIAGTTGQSKRIEAIQIKLVKKPVNVSVSLTYDVHSQTYGWMEPVTSHISVVNDSTIAGTVGKSKRLEAIHITLNHTGIDGGIAYSTHCQSYGWLPEVTSGELSGTQGESKRMEAIKIRLTGDVAAYYDIYYRVHCQTVGWLDWAKNGESAGTSGGSKRMEGIQIVLIPKGGSAPGSVATPFKDLTPKEFTTKDINSLPGELVVKINKQCNTVTVYKGNTAVKAMICSTGDATPLGTFYTSQKYRWHNLFFNCWGQYCTRITGHILFHSVPYHTPNTHDLETEEYNKLGTAASAGCIRLRVCDAKWIYDNCPSGTKIVIYNDSNPGPLGKPSVDKIPLTQNCDPTDLEK